MSSSDLAIARASAHALSYYNASSGGSLYTDISIDVDMEMFMQSGQRAGGPYLCSLPTRRRPIDQNSFAYTLPFEVMEENVGKILDNSGISYRQIHIIGNLSKAYPEPSPVPTVLISAIGRSRVQLWRDVAKTIHTYATSIYDKFSVEIIDEELEIPTRCFPVHQTDGIFHKWDNVRDTILSHLDIFDWTALECWRFGRSPSQMENPPTVLVSVREESFKNHHTDTQRIRGILAQFGESGVSVLFMRDRLVPHASDRPLPAEACTRLVQPGVSIGIQDSTAGSSTLGGMIEIRFPDHEQWQTFALTCFHAVYPPDGDRVPLSMIPDAEKALRLWKWQPVTFQTPIARQVLKIEQPSVQDIRNAINHIDDGINFYKDDCFNDMERRLQELNSSSKDFYISNEDEKRYKEGKKCIKTLETARGNFEGFLSQNHLGEVVAGSGFERTRRQIYTANGNYDCVVDWALIAVSQDRSREDNMMFQYPGLEPNLKFSSARKLDPKLVGQFHKAGRTTQFTTGEYGNVIQAKVARELEPHGQLQPKIAYEHTVVNTSFRSPFSGPGDSGSFIFDRGGGVIGLLTSGWERKNPTYFTPIENVFDDIKEVTGAVEVRIAD